MTIVILFTVMASFDFNANLGVDFNVTAQDYLLVEGPNHTAHLRRVDDVLQLKTKMGTALYYYESKLGNRSFTFFWNDYLVDGKPMKMKDGSTDLNLWNNEKWAFSLSNTGHVLNTSSIIPYKSNYWYLIVVAVVVLSLFKSTSLAQKLASTLLRKRDAHLFNQAIQIVEEELDSQECDGDNTGSDF